jgi:hypothetical protein
MQTKDKYLKRGIGIDREKSILYFIDIESYELYSVPADYHLPNKATFINRVPVYGMFIIIGIMGNFALFHLRRTSSGVFILTVIAVYLVLTIFWAIVVNTSKWKERGLKNAQKYPFNLLTLDNEEKIDLLMKCLSTQRKALYYYRVISFTIFPFWILSLYLFTKYANQIMFGVFFAMTMLAFSAGILLIGCLSMANQVKFVNNILKRMRKNE